MGTITRGAALFAVVSLALSGCSAFEPGLGFSDVERIVSERSGKEVHWNQGTPEDKAAVQKVQALLEQTLSVDSAIRVALLSNPRLQATFERLGIAQADMVQSGLLRNPILDAEARFSGEGTTIELSIVQGFLDVLYIPLRRQVGAAGFEATKLSIAASALDLAGQVRRVFYELQAIEQKHEMLGSVVAATDAGYDLAKRMRAAGNITDLDLANERALHEQSKLDLASAELASIEKREQLSSLMGVWGHEAATWKIATRLPPIPETELPLDQLEAQAIDRSLDLARMRHEIEIAGIRTGLAKPTAWLADADTGPAAEKESEGKWSVGPGFSVPIPLFDLGRAAAGKAGAIQRRVEEMYRAEAIEIRSEARTARARLVAARDRAEYRRVVLLPLRHRILSETQKHFNAMLVGAFQLLQAKQAELDAGNRYVDDLLAYWLAQSDLDQILSGSRPSSTRPVVELSAADDNEGTSTENLR
ncbi:MAG: TolC family protein [Deltaproteobacteria bacterium]|nr:TolC family protein [Deltaproteobacteria bacterium]